MQAQGEQCNAGNPSGGCVAQPEAREGQAEPFGAADRSVEGATAPIGKPTTGGSVQNPNRTKERLVSLKTERTQLPWSESICRCWHCSCFGR
jgi:hypothetical protein